MLWLVVVQPAYAQSSQDVLNRLNRIENEISTLSRAVYKGDMSPSSTGGLPGARSDANAEIRLQQLERELRDIRGIIEEQSHAVRQMQSNLDKAVSDIELRLGDLEGGGSAKLSSTSSSPPKPKPVSGKYTTDGRKVDSTGSASDAQANIAQNSSAFSSSASADEAASLYENAFAKLKNGQYDAAETEFQKFISQYPDHVLTSNAKYWLGETFYVRGSYEQAARLFAEGYKQYPNGSKAPDNLLKLGMSLSGLGNKKDACVAYEQLEKEFAGKSQPVLRRAKQEMTLIGCS